MPDSRGYIPVLMPDRTVVGRATISEDKKTVTIEIPDGDAIQMLMSENLIGLSVVYMGAIPFDMSNENKEKKSDDD